MAQQSNLFPPNPANPQQAGDKPRDGSASPSRASARQNPAAGLNPAPQAIPWMARVEAIVRILVRLYVGLLLLALPWLPFWTQNNLFTYDPLLLTLASSGFVRGVFSGLGLLGIILAVLEAKNARELS